VLECATSLLKTFAVVRIEDFATADLQIRRANVAKLLMDLDIPFDGARQRHGRTHRRARRLPHHALWPLETRAYVAPVVEQQPVKSQAEPPPHRRCWMTSGHRSSSRR
jgi:hypothetical protein